MNVQIQTLKAEIAADLKAITEIYDALTEYDTRLTGDERVIVLAYTCTICIAPSRASSSVSPASSAIRSPTGAGGMPGCYDG